MQTVLAVDPGGVSGVAWLVGEDFDSTEVPGGRKEFFTYFDQEWADDPPTVIVCEDFVITGQTAKKTPQPDALRIIGYLEGWCYLHRVPFVLQTPATGKGFGTTSKLKHLGWYKGGAGHADDAARHLLTVLKDSEIIRERLRDFTAY